MKQPVSKILFPILLLSWIVLITFLSLTPADKISTGLLNIKHLDKLVHFIFYFVFALLLYRIFFEYKLYSATISIIVAATVPIVYSGAMELFQEYLTTTRQADFFDFLMNMLGAGAAVILGSRILKFENSKHLITEFSSQQNLI